MMTKAIPRTIRIAAALFCTSAFFNPVKAQLVPFSGIYFHNRYQANPALAGLDKGLSLNLGVRSKAGNLPGSPKTQSLTGEFGFGDKVGIGFSAYNEKVSLITNSKVMGTYAYHLPMSGQGQKLSFGLSLGIMNEKLDVSAFNGTQGDAVIDRFNQKSGYVDGDAGLAYTSNKLTLQASLSNLKAFFNSAERNSLASQASFYTAASYKFYFSESLDGMGLEPMVAFRGAKETDSKADIGANLSFASDVVNLMGIYHSSKSASFGMSVKYKQLFTVLGLYTTETAALSSNSSGNFELNLKMNLFGK